MDISGHGHGHGHEGVEMAIPITTSYMGHQAHSQGLMNGPHPPPPPPPPPSTSITEEQQQHQQQQQHHQQNQKKGSWVKYKECLKNHAASIGGNATDGCGEFMPSGEEGSIEALKCSACNCHRNFHRKESEGPETYSLIPRSAGAHMVMPLGSFQTSESDEMDRHHQHHPHQAPVLMRKRFRTKFTPEQKEKMLEFAESVGWRLQKQEETVVQHFCQEIGVKRRVLKVWMHNNKHNLAKKINNVDDHPPPSLQLE